MHFYIEEELTNEQLVEKGKKLLEQKQYRIGLAYLHEAYMNKDAIAAYELAICYNEGIGVDINVLESFFYEEESAKLGYLLAQEEYAKRLLRRDKKNVNIARYWLRLASLQNSVYSLFLYSYLCYTRGSIEETNKYLKVLEEMGFNIEGLFSKISEENKDILCKLELDEFINIEG